MRSIREDVRRVFYELDCCVEGVEPSPPGEEGDPMDAFADDEPLAQTQGTAIVR